MSECVLCPRNCRADRAGGEVGFCGAGERIRVGRAALHFWEEPSISGEQGSGTVFFSGCNLRCVYCQNYKISRGNVGRDITVSELSDIFLDLQGQGAHNINLVTPTHYSEQIAEAIKLSKENGLRLPIVYNCGGYESVDSLRALSGLVDVYMPDLKYCDDKYASRYSSVSGYFNVATAAISEMFSQVGKNKFDENGMMTRGVIVRHMLLPGLMFDSKKILDYLYSTYGDDIYISIMSQYTPTPNVSEHPEINRKVTEKYYSALVDYAAGIGIINAYIQDGEAADESFIPEFYGE